VVLQTQGTMNPFLVIDSPTVTNLPITNGLALRTDPEMIRTTLEMVTTMTTMMTMTLSTPWMS